MECEESLEKVKGALAVLRGYKGLYDDHRAKLQDYFKHGREPILWEFDPSMVFARMDKFLERLEILEVSVSLTKAFICWIVFLCS